MKPVLMSDVIALARALRAVPHARRFGLIRQVLREAEEAGDWARRYRCTHPRYGNGSVMAAASGHDQVPEPSLTDHDYCRCLRDIFAALSEH